MENAKLLDQSGTRVVELDIEGMTCASCVGRVERKLGKLEGVEAVVNLPLESARVTVPAGITDDQLTATVVPVCHEWRNPRALLHTDTFADNLPTNLRKIGAPSGPRIALPFRVRKEDP